MPTLGVENRFLLWGLRTDLSSGDREQMPPLGVDNKILLWGLRTAKGILDSTCGGPVTPFEVTSKTFLELNPIVR